MVLIPSGSRLHDFYQPPTSVSATYPLLSIPASAVAGGASSIAVNPTTTRPNTVRLSSSASYPFGPPLVSAITPFETCAAHPNQEVLACPESSIQAIFPPANSSISSVPTPCRASSRRMVYGPSMSFPVAFLPHKQYPILVPLSYTILIQVDYS